MIHAGAGDNPTPCPGVPNLLSVVGKAWGDTDMALKIKRARKTVPLVTDLSLAAEHERASQALQDAQRRAKQEDRENAPEVRKAAARVVELEDAMRAVTIYVELEAWQRKRWAEFRAAHPPKDGDEVDKAFDIDVSSVDKALGSDGSTWPRTIVGAYDHEDNPVEFDGATWAEVTEEISQAQWEPFFFAVLGLNQKSADAPFSLAASRVTQNSDAT